MTDSRETVPRETWKPIEGFPGYEVSDAGRVRSPFGNYIGRPSGPRGHVRVQLPGQQTRAVHQLVAEAFIGPARGRRVERRDRNPTNNSVSNLRYGL